MNNQDILNRIFETIQSRKTANSDESYVASLFERGTEKIAEKVGEESVETIIEAVKGDKDALAQESADLLFHLMVLWADQGLMPDDILNILESREGISGHDEKAARS